jgi:predicted XRE-type DNA-binding protein
MSETNPTTDPDVEYRELARFVGYRFGTDGSFWSRWKQIHLSGRWGLTSVLTDEWTLIPGSLDRDGYRRVALKTADNPKRRPFLLHRLILEAFVSPCPPGMEACHRPGAPKSSCRLEDLRWDSHSSNLADRIADGTDMVGEKNGRAKLTWDKVDEVHRLRREGMSQDAIAALLGVTQMMISRICCGKAWTRRP